jgi:hypothetical protein
MIPLIQIINDSDNLKGTATIRLSLTSTISPIWNNHSKNGLCLRNDYSKFKK